MSGCPPTNIGPGASSRKTYDTDSLVMRRIFAYDPMTNTPLSTNYILSADVKGVVLFKNPLEVLSTFGWADLPDQIVSTTIFVISSISTTNGYLASTVSFFAPSYPSSQQIFLPSTVNGLGTTGYISTTSLTSSLIGLGSMGYLSSGIIITPLNSTIVGLGSSGFISSTQLTSSLVGLGSIGFISSSQLTSSVVGLGSIGYISSTQLLSSLVGLGSLGYISSASLYSTVNTALASTVKGMGSATYVSSTQLTSSIVGLGSSGYLSSFIFSNLSTVFLSSGFITASSISTFGLAVSGVANISTLFIGNSNISSLFVSTSQGLASIGYISSSQLTSSLVGLGSLGYISSATLYSTVNMALASTVAGLGTATYVSSTQLTSSLIGLASIGYVSSTQLTSSLVGLASIGYVSSTQLTSSLVGLASIRYVSSTQLTSSLVGLASIGYVSSTQLTSSLVGLASIGYVSSTQLFSSLANFTSIRSTFSNSLAGNWSNTNFLYTGITVGTTLSTIRFDLGPAFRNKMLSGAANSRLDIETKTNLQFGYYDSISRDYQFNTYLVIGSTFATTNIIGTESFNYYILNANAINQPYFSQEKSRFIITDSNTISSIKYWGPSSTITLFHTFGPNVPGTNQFFASPASTASVTVVLDNLPLA